MSAPDTDAGTVDDGTEPLDESIEAFRRVTSEVGVRNRILVVPSVICSHIVADRIAQATDNAVSTPHDHGCAQIGADHEQTERTLLNLAQNPNIAGATVVGLGCEHLQSGPFAERIADAGVPVRETAIQNAGGSDACIEEGKKATTELAADAAEADRTDATLSDLTVGVVSSDLAPTTREIADPLVGEAVDTLLEAGARVLVTGTERLVSSADAAADRAETDTVGDELRDTIERTADQPGNVRGIARRATELPFRSVVGAWGSGTVSEVVPYGCRPSVTDGLVVVDSPSRFEEATTALAAAGASIVIHVTAEGVPTGHPVVPVCKVTGDGETADALEDDIDIDARSATPDELLAELHRVAGGKPTAAEQHGLTKFAINRVGPSM
ncbi:UxaA family hydrolase [Halopiger aswanensis]|uniref:Altronate dehydratase large subunit n=1 Tax=Halopiger aswanensis TaxID=148449 RepID=A0A419W109_9EURY|nr:UxaA family hydrolase [Halopiger aswanensis]RKD89185.1 altronate dehydratase large subunit [Halopiger aswanensis]